MLVDLKVKNFALIDNLEINFTGGLNVMTGETGAGKSIIVGALEMLLGERASREVIRQGKERTFIEAVFEPAALVEINQILEEAGIEVDENILLLSREIRRNNRNRSRINGQLATLAMVRKVSQYLVDIHGQHEHQSLLNTGIHLELLDECLEEQARELKAEIGEKFSRLKEIEKELEGLNIDDAEKARQLDLLEFQIEEIEKADLEPGEMDRLKQEYDKLSNLEEIAATTGEVFDRIDGGDYGDQGLLDQMGYLMKQLETVKGYDEQLEELYSTCQDIFYRLQDLSFETRNYYDNITYDRKRLTEVEERIDLINNLKRKYGDTIEDIIAYCRELKEKRRQLIDREEQIEELKLEQEELKTQYYELAQKLSSIRQQEAKNLEQEIEDQFKDLALNDAVFRIDFTDGPPRSTGLDGVEFMISTNPGEELKPLNKIASGGEISRIMLALKTIIADIDRVDTLIFDEIDQGVGGKIAQKMGKKLARIGRRKQIICITHLPQIASMADTHYYIKKESENNRTYTTITDLNEKEKRRELARMLGGVELTDTTLKHAAEMLEQAEEIKQQE